MDARASSGPGRRSLLVPSNRLVRTRAWFAHWSGSVGHVRGSPSRMHSRPSRKGIGYADRRDERRPLLPPSPPAGGSVLMPVGDATAETCGFLCECAVGVAPTLDRSFPTACSTL